jgi:hypothetical protein
MLRTYAGVIALAVMGLSPAQAADEVLTLACQGTTTRTTTGAAGGAKSEPVSVGIIVNFTNHTVQFSAPSLRDQSVEILRSTHASVAFFGSLDMGPAGREHIIGFIDRV